MTGVPQANASITTTKGLAYPPKPDQKRAPFITSKLRFEIIAQNANNGFHLQSHNIGPSLALAHNP